MFNPVAPWEVTLAVGQVLRAAAAAGPEADEYARSQLLSAASISRYLAAEQAGAAELLDAFRGELLAVLEGHPARERLERAGGAAELGEAVADLLAALRAPGAACEPLRAELHALLRRLADREVALLARAPDRPRRGSE